MYLLKTEFDRSELTLCGSQDVKIQLLLLERVRTIASLLQWGFSLLKRQTFFFLSRKAGYNSYIDPITV